MAGLGWRTITRLYYSQTKEDISWMTLERRLIEAEFAARESNNLPASPKGVQ
ncbi:hypothetical protein ACFLTP_10115 [Chloroflexota bacterium]